MYSVSTDTLSWGFVICIWRNKSRIGASLTLTWTWPGVLHNILQEINLLVWQVFVLTCQFSSVTVTHIWKHLKACWEVYNITPEPLKRPQRFHLLWRFLSFNWCWLAIFNQKGEGKLKLGHICCNSLLYQVAALRDFNCGISWDDMTGKSDSRAPFVCWDVINLWNNCA